MRFRVKQWALAVALSWMAAAGHAQYLRTSYFMDGSSRLQLNPAYVPDKGFVIFPALGMINASAYTNSLGTQDLIDIFDSGDELWGNPSFHNKLKDMNKATLSAAIDILSMGWWKGRGFWSVNLGVRTDTEGRFPRSLFDYLRDMPRDNAGWNNSRFSIRDQALSLNSYIEVGVGYACTVGDRLTVGGKFNFLLGAGNLNLQVNSIEIASDFDGQGGGTAEIDVDARAEANILGLDLLMSGDGYVDEMEYNKFGFGGYGAGIDLGATYRLLDNLTLSAAVTDLGFIKWNKSSSNVVEGRANERFDAAHSQDFYDRVSGGEVIDFDLLALEKSNERKARSTRLPTTLTLGTEYAFFGDKLSAGILSTTRWGQLNTLSELTVIGTYRPKGWFNLALSYSMLQSAGQSFGLGLKLGPLMLGTDYMYLGKNSRSVNGYLGLAFSFGQNHREKKHCPAY